MTGSSLSSMSAGVLSEESWADSSAARQPPDSGRTTRRTTRAQQSPGGQNGGGQRRTGAAAIRFGQPDTGERHGVRADRQRADGVTRLGGWGMGEGGSS